MHQILVLTMAAQHVLGVGVASNTTGETDRSMMKHFDAIGKVVVILIIVEQLVTLYHFLFFCLLCI